MNDNLMDVITLCDYEMCPTIKSNNGAIALIVVRSDEESQLVDRCIDHSFEPNENRAVGDAQR